MSWPSLHPSERTGALPAKTANAMPQEAAAPHTPHLAHVAPGTQAARESSSVNASERPAPSCRAIGHAQVINEAPTKK